MGITDRRKNCLSLIKLLAAIQVFLGHAVPSFNIEISKSVSFLISVLEGVPIFFCLSGFLIWGSIERSHDIKNFTIKRVARLYPELWGGVLLNAVIMIALNHKHLKWPSFLLFQITQGTIFQFWTPDSLRGYATGIPNTPLWTIGVMVQCYFALWFCYKVLHKKRKIIWLFFIVISISFNLFRPLLEPYLPHVIYRLIWNSFLIHLWMFLLGAFIWEFFDNVIGILKRMWPLTLCLAIIVNYFSIDIGNYAVFKSISLLMFVIGYSYSFPQFNLKHDYSYGIYIYHMIVINVMVFLGLNGTIANIILAFAITLLLSIISYHSLGHLGQKKRNAL